MTRPGPVVLLDSVNLYSEYKIRLISVVYCQTLQHNSTYN